MPIRKKLVFTPPSLERVSSEDEDDYLQDPDQLHDILPQPYRRIDKILNELLDNVWTIVSKKEDIKLREISKRKSPNYVGSTTLPFAGQATVMTESPDGCYVFVGMPNGLLAIDCQTQKLAGCWVEDNVEITHCKAHIIGPHTYIIVTLDDIGISRIFGYAGEMYLMKTLNEVEHNHRIIVSKAEASPEGDFIGLGMENTSAKESWLEIFRLPRDQWLHELNAQMRLGDRIAASSTSGLDSAVIEGAEHFTNVESYNPTPRASLQKQSSPPPAVSCVNVHDKSSIRFSSPTLLLRLRPPTSLITSYNIPLQSAMQKIDTGDVIGSGHNHIISGVHWELRDAMFNHCHANLLKYLPDENQDSPAATPHFHFLNPGRQMLYGLEGSTHSTVPVGVAVWWRGGTQLLQYSFAKLSTVKAVSSAMKSRTEESPSPKLTMKTSRLSRAGTSYNVEVETKPDVLWPFMCNITSSATSPCSSLIAIGLASGTVCIHDRYLGLAKGVMNVSSQPVEYMEFLNPAIFPRDTNEYQPYRISATTFLLAACADGTQYTVNVEHMRYTTADCIKDVPESPDEKETIIGCMQHAPELFLVAQRQGRILLRDITTRSDVVELSLPDNYKLKLPWEPVISFGLGGLLIFLKGTLRDLAKPDVPDVHVSLSQLKGYVEEVSVDGKPEARDAKSSSRQYSKMLAFKMSKTTAVFTEEEDEGDHQSQMPEKNSSLAEPPSYIFVFAMRSFPTLDKYWLKQRPHNSLLVHTTLEQRVEALLKERLHQQPIRKNQMQLRWRQMRSDLDLLLQSKERSTNLPMSKLFSLESFNSSVRSMGPIAGTSWGE